ncbi:MAG: PQQ-binding-like beta-propeller repeat protein [Candidatus Riflebacteria bacterium]|nr:PQQ-binding-like beta-propeller repeat protein [Candidatus Riflebacteria bacterium]
MNRWVVGFFLVFALLTCLHFWNQASGTTPRWQARYDREILSAPCRLGPNVAVLGGREEIALLDPQGRILARQPLPRQPRHPLVALTNVVVVADREQGLRAYGGTGLTLRWERATQEPSTLAPLPLPDNRLLVKTSAKALVAVDGDSGDPAWDAQFTGDILHVAVGSAVACIYGFQDVKNPVWRLQAVDLEFGQPLWTFPGEVAPVPPIAHAGMFLFVTAQGTVVGADQETGELRLKIEGMACRHLEADGDVLLMLASDGRRLDASSFSGKGSWSVSLPATFLDAAVTGNLVMVADRSTVRCLEAATGAPRWQKDLGPILLAYPHREGMALLHKGSFIDRQSLFAYYPARTGSPDWVCVEPSMFHPPLAFGSTDMAVCRNGALYGMPVTPAPAPPAAAGSFTPDLGALASPGADFLNLRARPATPSSPTDSPGWE